MSSYEKIFAYATLPTATTRDTFPATGVNTGSLNLSAFIGQGVSFKASAACAMRAGSAASVAATAADYPMEADRDYYAVINTGTAFVSVFGLGSAGTVYFAKTSGI